MEEIDLDLEEPGPVDYFIVEFPADEQRFTGEMADELVRLVEDDTIRLLGVLVLKKEESGGVTIREVRELGEPDSEGASAVVGMAADLAEMLATDDVVHLAEDLSPGSVAAVVVWENRWVAPFAAAARRAGGQLVSDGRIPVQAILAAIQSDKAHAIGSGAD